jgi:putative PIN family toxin of toxin-antitoxin system
MKGRWQRLLIRPSRKFAGAGEPGKTAGMSTGAQQKRVVIDTNVLVRTTFLKHSPISARIYQAIADQECILVLLPSLLAEIRDVISRDYIIAYTHTTPASRQSYINTLIDLSILTSETHVVQRASRDKKDNKFLVCAHEAQATYIVTNDRDLLDVKLYRKAKMIPRRNLSRSLTAMLSNCSFVFDVAQNAAALLLTNIMHSSDTTPSEPFTN